jgi:hypothetical protein
MNNVGLILALDDRHIAVCLTHASRTSIKNRLSGVRVRRVGMGIKDCCSRQIEQKKRS